MLADTNLNQTFSILQRNLKQILIQLNIDSELSRITIKLKDGSRIYIQYNDYGEYGYMVLFSEKELDRCRFDHYDKDWRVTTNPNHFHPWKDEQGYSSPMTGKPDEDIPRLCDLILRKTLKNKTLRF